MANQSDKGGPPAVDSSPMEQGASWRRIVVVVPCFNERNRLNLEHFEDYARENREIGFLFVDDGSVDGTGDLIREFVAAAEDRLRLLHLDRNRGKAEAVRAGLLRALESEPEVLGFWDADLATPLEELTAMLGVLESAPLVQVVLGSRVRLLGRTIERRATRHYLGRVFATGASLTLNMPVYDTQCGAKLFRTTPGLQSLLGSPFRSRWVFDVEILARFGERFGTEELDWIEEYPLSFWSDVGGSKLRLIDFLSAARDLARIWIGRKAG